MDWGDVPAWAAIAGSGAAIWISIKARGDGKRSVEIAAEALELQRQAAQPKVALRIRVAGRGVYRLQNYGDAPAPALAILSDDADLVLWDQPLGGTLPPGDCRDFTTRSPANEPTGLRFTWEGQTEPIHVPMP